jgi:hypothetical protein
MAEIDFALVPYEPSDLPITITGTVQRVSNKLVMEYELRGDLSQIAIAPPEQPGSWERRDYLWEQTCFECFFGPKGQPNYWEINLSPAGHWAFYRFSNHRAEIMQPEPFYSELPFTVTQTPEILTISLSVSLDPIVTRDQSLDVGITAVIKTKTDQESYWALSHGEPADFHNRATFMIGL